MNAISSGRVAQAYLFVGPRGIGKTSTARILAKALNCENGPTATPCGTCVACQEIAEGRSLDVLEIDGASNNGVENIRELRENASYAPARGPYKIYLIDEVHMLSTGAFNALLKTLEEPPEHVKFIFATTEAQKVPATITSRCQRFDLRRIPDASISSHMLTIAEKEGIALEPAAADAIARGADGGLRDAESMLDQAVAFCGKTITAVDIMDVFGFTSLEVVSSLLDSIFACDTANALAVISEQATAGKDLPGCSAISFPGSATSSSPKPSRSAQRAFPARSCSHCSTISPRPRPACAGLRIRNFSSTWRRSRPCTSSNKPAWTT